MKQPDSTPASGMGAGSVLARSVLLSISGQTLPLVAGVVVTPFIVGRLGGDRFGVLSLAWTVLTLSLLFNLGLGRATTKFAAEHMGRGETVRLPALFWMSIVLNTVMGLIGAAFVALGSVWLITLGVLKVPTALQSEASAAFVVIALALPFTFVTTTLRGMLEAGQHFAEINWARLIFTTAIFVLPAVSLLFSPRLLLIVWLLTLSRVAEMVAYGWLCFRRFPAIRSPSIATAHLRQLLVYGGWLTVTNMLLPLIMNMDRFIIGSLLSVRAVAYYSVPADLSLRLTALPASIVVPLFPAFSALEAENDRARIRVLCARSMKYVTLSGSFAVGIIVAFAHTLLSLWLGAEFAANSSTVMQIMAVGVLINSIAFLPSTVLHAVGRPDLTAKFHLFQTPIAVALMWFLTRDYGIAGTALAWGARVALDLGLLMYATFRLGYLSAAILSETLCTRALVLGAVFVAAGAALSYVVSEPLRVSLVAGLALVWSVATIFLALDEVEHRWLLMLPRKAGWVAA